MNNFIQLLNINKNFDSLRKVKVLKKISYKFNKGKIYSLMGPSGSGKSTLLNLLSLIDIPTSGSLKISNHPINYSSKSYNDNLRAKKIGIIYQDNNLLSDFTAIENIYFARLSINENKNKALIDAKKLIRNLGLSNRENHLATELSGGEMQRVAIARALINNPSVIFADEPSGNLDSANAKKLHKLFFELRERHDQTFVMVTHNREFAEMSDRMLEMKDGLIIQ